jgi:HPt (histidine-containing phosphotransfer) domain-containing protein
MPDFETFLLLLAIVMIIFLLLLTLFKGKKMLSKMGSDKNSQAEELKALLDEYVKTTPKSAGKSSVPKTKQQEAIAIPTKTYPPFDNSRAVTELSLSQEEADMFVGELIKAVDAEVKKLDKAIANENILEIEEITHTITGSASTIGYGGITNVLIDFYTAVQHRETYPVLKTHLANLKYYLDQLKEQHAAKNTQR